LSSEALGPELLLLVLVGISQVAHSRFLEPANIRNQNAMIDLIAIGMRS
jgi:hypothetical protein